MIANRIVGREEEVRSVKAGRIRLKGRQNNPYVRFVIKSMRVSSARSRRGKGKHTLTLFEEAPGELWELANYFTEIGVHEMLSILPSSIVTSFIESESISLIDVARVLIVAAERISKEIERIETRMDKAERNSRNAVARYLRRAEKKSKSWKKTKRKR